MGTSPDTESMTTDRITILGVGNILLSDEGIGIRVIEKLDSRYEFAENVQVLDGGVLGIHLVGLISGTDHLIVVDAVRNNGSPGSLYRLGGDQIPKRILAKNSLHQVDLLEALTLVEAIGPSPATVVVGIEPLDIDTMSLDLTPLIASKLDDLVAMVLAELDRLGASYTLKGTV
jgi:hydrogenase maturation protease